MHFHIMQPTGFLRKYIKYYCFMESDRHEELVTERVIPIEGVQMMFHYGDPFVVNHPGDSISTQPRSIVTGLCNTYTDVSTNGDTGVVFIRFFPEGACNFFDFPLNAIENLSVDTMDLFRTEIRIIEERLYSEKTITGKTQIIEAFLLRHFLPVRQSDYRFIQTGIQLIKVSEMPLTTSGLSKTMAVTTKTLERKFSSLLGMSPKQFMKLVRYQKNLENLGTLKHLSLSELAYQTGYFDQSHFIKDFKAFTGYTPGEFIHRYPDYNGTSETC